jgi:hypothetical protein
MKRSFGLLVASVATVLGLLALVGIPLISGGSAPSVASAATPTAQQIGMKVLLITDSTDPSTASGIAYGDWVNTLKREGVPYDSVITNSASVGSVPLPVLSSTLSNGNEVANYEGVVVATSGTEGLSTAQWTALQTFEQHFSVRQVTAYAVPDSSYGLAAASPVVTFSGSPSPTLTAAGAQVFPYLNKVGFDPGTFGYEGTPAPPTGATVATLISGPGSSSLLGIYTSSDGRQTMYQTFNQNQYMVQSELLRHGELAWLARNTYFGDQRNYLETNIDDNFLSDDSWNTATHATDFTPTTALREVPADVTTAATWSATNKFRIDMLFNGGGSVAAANGAADPLLVAFQADKNDFGWINHTWDHPNLDEGCATQNYIEAEINQNTAWGSKAATAGNPTTGGLGLTSSTAPTQALGSENPNVVVTGEHAGLANLIPGNPGQVDPPFLDAALAATTGGTLATGEYVYAVSDQFNTAAPGAAPVPATTGESAASVSAAVPVTGPTGAVALTWGAVCHAADYKVYRAPYTPVAPPATGGTIGTYTLIGTVNATAADFVDPASTSDTTGGGAIEKTFTDTGAAGTTGAPLTAGTAVESPYEQNPALDLAFAGTSNGGIKYFGSDASKPYPNPADGTFATGTTPSGTFGAGSTFTDAGASAIPRYPTNIYYNVSTEAQEVDEYNYLYLPSTLGGACVNSSTTTCLTAPATFADIINSVDSGMFQHMMGNDPRPHYFHQTNMMGQPPAGPPTTGTPPATLPSVGDGLFYSTLNQLLNSDYSPYFASNAPIEQLTMAQIGTLLSEQSNWAAANGSQVSGNVQGNVVTVTNNGSAIELPLTGTTVGSAYAGSQSGWTLAPSGTSTYTALAAWPAPPVVPVVVTPPNGPAPGTPPPTPPVTKPIIIVKKSVTMLTVQVAPKTVHIKRGRKVTVSLKCEAPKGDVCSGTFELSVSKQTLKHSFRIKAGKTARIAIVLPKKLKLPVKAHKASRGHRANRAGKLSGKLTISTNQTARSVKISRGKLTIES